MHTIRDIVGRTAHRLEGRALQGDRERTCRGPMIKITKDHIEALQKLVRGVRAANELRVDNMLAYAEELALLLRDVETTATAVRPVAFTEEDANQHRTLALTLEQNLEAMAAEDEDEARQIAGKLWDRARWHHSMADRILRLLNEDRWMPMPVSERTLTVRSDPTPGEIET